MGDLAGRVAVVRGRATRPWLPGQALRAAGSFPPKPSWLHLDRRHRGQRGGVPARPAPRERQSVQAARQPAAAAEELAGRGAAP
ncbi:hypothetical protein LT493_20690 [Streptomyces tricolor]|nr:hypothetical protein [Streptomyces tricolor]